MTLSFYRASRRWYRGSSCLFSSLPHSSNTIDRVRNERKGKSPGEWTVEEVGEGLRVLEEQVERGEVPLPGQVAQLLHPIRIHRTSGNLSRVLDIVRRSKVRLEEGLGSALVSSLAGEGRTSEVKEVVGQIAGRLRCGGQFSILDMACRHNDPDLAIEFLTGQPVLPETLIDSLISLSQETERPDLVKQLLSVMMCSHQCLSVSGADRLKSWATCQSEPYSYEETTITRGGVCRKCGSTLNEAMTEDNHQKLLSAMIEAVNSEGLGFSPELISNLYRLDKRLSSVSTPFRVVVDGLNVSRVSSKNFSVMRVMDIVNKLIATIGGPVLVVARKHLAQEMDELPSFYSSIPRSQDFHVFTTHINEISDDICVIYAALSTGKECYIVSNDHMSDNAAMLNTEDANLFQIWQASRQITVEPAGIQLLYPPNHSQAVQCSENGWHIPLTLPPTTATTKDAWRQEGRRSWEEESTSSIAKKWLCISKL